MTTHIWAGLLWEALFIVQAGDSADTTAALHALSSSLFLVLLSQG